MAANRFLERSSMDEQMDDLQVQGPLVDQTLQELDTINKWLGGNQVTLIGLQKILQDYPEPANISIADLGCGSGKMLQLISKWGARHRLGLSLQGLDANDYIVQYATKAAADYPDLSFRKVNIMDKGFQQERYDIITSTLFTHHFSNSQLVEFITGWLQQSNYGIVINDLHRHWFAYYAIKGITSIVSKSEMVRQDAPVSVLRGFIKSDWVHLMKACGIKEYHLSWHWAFRWLLVIPKGH